MKRIDGYDVVVIGGGPGGLGSAVMAARDGAKTLLIEREGFLGGGATAMMVHPFMPHMTNGPDSKAVNAGLFRELAERLVARGSGVDCRAVRFDDEALKLVADELVTEAGADVLFHAALFDVEKSGGRIDAAILATNAGPVRIEGKVFIDSTGDGVLALCAGCEQRVGDDDGLVMPMTLNFAVAGVEAERVPDDLKDRCRRGAEDDPPLINTNLSCTSWTPGGLLHFNAIRIPGDTTDPMDVSRAEIEGRRRVDNFVAWLKANVPGFENCRLAKTAPHIGIRESRRIVGDYVLTIDDFKSAAKFDDGICCCSYEVDKHLQKQGQTLHIPLPAGEYYQVPYRCLRPVGTENLLVASRCISADCLVHSSIRIMPPVMNIGEAAGHAAAMSLPSGQVRDIDVETLRRKIRNTGGILEL